MTGHTSPPGWPTEGVHHGRRNVDRAGCEAQRRAAKYLANTELTVGDQGDPAVFTHLPDALTTVAGRVRS